MQRKKLEFVSKSRKNEIGRRRGATEERKKRKLELQRKRTVCQLITLQTVRHHLVTFLY